MNIKNQYKRILTLALIIITIFSITSAYAFSEEDYSVDKLDEDLEYLKNLMLYVQDTYKDDVSLKELMDGAYKGIFSKLDTHSNYYNSEEFEELNSSVSGDFGGVGIQIEEKDGFIIVVSPIDGTPGEKSGIKPGDKIISVDEINIENYSVDQAAAIIRGEAGSNVKLGIIREGIKDTLYFDITREIIKINPVTFEVLDNKIGYIKISQFNSHTYTNIVSALNEFDNKEISKIIIDLRYNPGGYLNEVIEIAKLFVPEGPIVHIKSSNGVETHKSTLTNPKYDLAVLVNEGSASASEIFAGAVKDSKVGTLIGTTTYGKGTVQNLIQLTNGGGLKITIAEYLTRNLNKVDGIGVEPDIIVEDKLDSEIDLESIPALNKKRKSGLGVVGLDVLGAEMILDILGYDVNEPDGVLDEVTFNEIKDFQRDNNLYSYGVLDFSTQDTLTKAFNEYLLDNDKDNVLEKAIELFSKN